MKKKFILPAVIVFVVGFVLGLFIRLDAFPPEFLGGDVSKAKKAGQAAPATARQELIVQHLRTDTVYRNQVSSALSIATLYSALVETSTQIAMEAATYVDSLREENKLLEGLHNLAANSAVNSSVALAAVHAAASGSDVSVEQALNNALLSYMALNRSARAASAWVEKAAKFLAANEVKEYQKLAFAIGVLAEEELLAHIDKAIRLSPEESKAVFNSLTADQQTAMQALSKVIANTESANDVVFEQVKLRLNSQRGTEVTASFGIDFDLIGGLMDGSATRRGNIPNLLPIGPSAEVLGSWEYGGGNYNPISFFNAEVANGLEVELMFGVMDIPNTLSSRSPGMCGFRLGSRQNSMRKDDSILE